MATHEPMVKGALIREYLRWYAERFGADAVVQMALLVPEEHRALVDAEAPGDAILPSSWYPARLVHTMLDAIVEHNPGVDIERLMKEAARNVLRHSTSGVYRFLLEKLVTPDLYAASVPRLWGQLHTSGKRQMEIIERGVALSTVSSWTGHHPILCTITIETMMSVFELMGCRDVRWERTQCVSHGGSRCITRVTWASRR
ncbi:MAG: hypothetical protein K0S65_1838 [Labilithrix sp.]|nr:hypothetical protein [Labilithrix sp.]